ncbi:MAG: glutamate synthase-related protein [Spirochaetota bacterium]
MPKKYHIETKPILPRRPRVGQFGIVDWREDCARCHNCVKKLCIYDRHRQEAEYIRKLDNVDTLFFECMGCFFCVQECTKNLLRLSVNPMHERLGNRYWTPNIIRTTWLQAETAKIPVSGAGYRGKFTGPGFDSMWTDMSEIVRPTRDGIHGREYISTATDIGRKLMFLSIDGEKASTVMPPLAIVQMPMIIDMMPEEYSLPVLEEIIITAAARTDLIAIIDSSKWPLNIKNMEKVLPYLAFYLNPAAPPVPAEILKNTRLVEIPDSENIKVQIKNIKDICPDIVISIRVKLDSNGIKRAIELGTQDNIEAIHIVADLNGDQIGTKNPIFLKDMIRDIHTKLIDSGKRDQLTLIASGGIALPEHMAKAIICGADLVAIELPLLIALECHLCSKCERGSFCPVKLEDVDSDYAAGRMVNLISAWHDQLIELMGAMGIRDARRLRGDVGRCMFFEQLEEESFGRIFGTRL